LIDLHVKDEGLALSLQDRITELNRTVILPALAEACDQLVGEDQLIQIDTLELDVGDLQLDDLEESMKEKVINQFKEQVFREVQKNLPRTEGGDRSQKGSSRKEKKRQSSLTGHVRLLAYYLEHGTRPWWQSDASPPIREICEEVAEVMPESFFERIAPMLASRSVRLRLIDNFTPQQLIRLIAPDNVEKITSIWPAYEKLASSAGEDTSGSFLFNRSLFDKLLMEIDPRMTAESKAEKIKQEMELQLQRVKPGIVLMDHIKKSGISPTETGRILEMLEDTGQKRADQKGLKPIPEDQSGALQKDKRQKKTSPTTKVREETFISVNNAGIVLLWPYLEMFFNELQYTRDGDFSRDEDQWKAVHMLHFLAFGDEPGEEADWALNKIICGLETDDYVPLMTDIPDSEKEEAENMLQAVIRNWKVLKNTSVEGLRQAFLRREGIIREDAQGYIIEIEKSTFDVLLERLTWPISVVRLPWMKGVIHVKW
jgi:hypothetical protein